MAGKNNTEVTIGDKVIRLGGSESEEYMQRVAAYINGKYDEYSKIESFRRQPSDMKSVLMQINIADDYFKAKNQLLELQEELEAKDKELYDIKHELISAQIKLENKGRINKSYREDNSGKR
ncbi:MAG: cell division protein ZapA [Lachnospiraceae bacterium]|nr:cell division protein ZapA [Lachnospiraceae bacterium]